jgi:hypothetical protein
VLAEENTITMYAHSVVNVYCSEVVITCSNIRGGLFQSYGRPALKAFNAINIVSFFFSSERVPVTISNATLSN